MIRLCVIWSWSTKGPESLGAYVPDRSGCVAVGESEAEVLHLIKEAIELHLEELKEDGQSIPSPHSSVE